MLKARLVEKGNQAAFTPAPIEEVVATIASEKPDVVFAPHVETASGIILPDDYLGAVADAVHEMGGLFVLDCIASGAIWVDMEATGVDVLISAPQKGWSASPCGGLVMMSSDARKRLEGSNSSSFACDLKKWMQIMEAYEAGGHAYHATMPTDALVKFHGAMKETETYGFDKVKNEQWDLGTKVRALLVSRGFRSVAAEGFQAPGVVVCYTTDADIQTGKKFAAAGLQIVEQILDAIEVGLTALAPGQVQVETVAARIAQLVGVDPGLGGLLADHFPVGPWKGKFPHGMLAYLLPVQFVDMVIRNHALKRMKLMITVQQFADLPVEDTVVRFLERDKNLFNRLFLFEYIEKKFPAGKPVRIFLWQFTVGVFTGRTGSPAGG